MKSYFWFSLLVLILLSCSSENIEQDKPKVIPFETHSETGVSIELSLPHGDTLKYFGVCQSKNQVDVLIRNNSSSMVHFYETWNSWGYYNFHFEISTADSLYEIRRTRNIWWKNFPSYHSINPGQSLVFPFELVDSSCTDHSSNLGKLRGINQWYGLPNKEYDMAEIRVIYNLAPGNEIVPGRRYHNADSVSNNETRIFSKQLISEPVGIRIHD